MGIGDDQLHPGQPTGLQAAQELGPEGAVLGVADGEAEDLAAAVTAHPGGDHHGLGGHPAIGSGLAVGGVHDHIREHLTGQRPIPEDGHLAVEVGADAADLALADAAVSPQGADQVVDLAVETPCR